MTIGELMDELAKYPRYLDVHVLLSEVIQTTKRGERVIMLCTADALPLDRIRYEGSHVLLESI